jgi:hypothetical protein
MSMRGHFARISLRTPLSRASLLRRLVVALLPFAVYAVLAVLLNIDVWRSPLTRYVGGGTDSEQTMWFLAWTPFALAHHQDLFVSHYMGYPAGFNLLWNTAIPAAGVLLWPITAIWNTVLTYNLVMTGSSVLAAGFAYLAIRRHVEARIPAFLGGLLYGFSPYVIAQDAGHAHLVLSTITPPLALLLLDSLVIRQKMAPWLLAFLITALAVLQFFIAQEVFVTEIIVAGVVLCILAAVHPGEIRAAAPYALRVLVRALPLTAAVLAYPIFIQLLGPDRVMGPIHDTNVYVTDPLSLVVPTVVQQFAPHWATSISKHFSGNSSEWNSYVGIPLLALLLLVLVRWWRVPVVRVSGLTAIVVTLLSFGPFLHIRGRVTPIPLPWWIPAHLPVVDSILPNRLMLFFYLAAGVGLAFGLQRIWAARRGALAAFAVAVVTLVPLLPHMPLPSTAISTPAYFSSTAVDEIPDAAVVLTVPWSSLTNTTPMNWQRAAGMRFRILGGYFLGPSATSSALQHAIDAIEATGSQPALDASEREQFRGELQSNDVAAVIAGPSTHQSVMISFFTQLLGVPPETHGEVAIWPLAPGAVP